MELLSLDFGTSALKAAVLNERLELLRETSVSYSHQVKNLDWVEMRPEDIWGAAVKAIRALVRDPREIGMVGYDTFSPSLVFMDAAGEALVPVVTHLDRRSKEQTRQILARMSPEEFQAITGVLPFTGGVSVTTILWFLQNMPAVVARAKCIGHLNTYLHHRLTGRFVIDDANASMMGLYETTKPGSAWCPRLLEEFAIPGEKLPRLHPAGAAAGGITRQAARQTGLLEGTPVTLGTNDIAVAQVGAGNTRGGDMINTCGSSETISILTESPVPNKGYYLRKSAVAGLWQIFAITTSGFAIDWFRKQFCRELDKGVFYGRELPQAMALATAPRGEAFAPYLTGDRQSLRPKKGSFTGLTLETDRLSILAALLAGSQQPILQAIRLAGELGPLNREIKITGRLAGEEYIRMKQALLPGYTYRTVYNASVVGNAALCLAALDSAQA